MREYAVCCDVRYVLVVEAETEEEARREATETDFGDWEQYPSDEYDVELIGKESGQGSRTHTFFLEVKLEPENDLGREAVKEKLAGALKHSTAGEAIVEATGCEVFWGLVEPDSEKRKRKLAKAIGEVVNYLWDEEQKHFELGEEQAGEHIFHHLVTLRSWLEEETNAGAGRTESRL